MILIKARIATYRNTAQRLILFFVLGIFVSTQPACADDEGYLSSSEIGAITIVSAGSFAAGQYLKNTFGKTKPRWTEPPGIDLWFANSLGTKPRPGPLNFMDSNRASGINVFIAGSIVASLDAAYPNADRTKDILQGQFLYYSGLLAQKGIGGIFKGVVARQRPIARLYPNVVSQDNRYSKAFYQQSFFSGHSSSSFYAMTFLNKRIRDAMRQQMTSSEFDSWSWLSPVVTYGWATYVAGSRIHAHKHYFTDVVAGAVAGWLIGELFYSFGNNVREDSSEPMLLKVSFEF